MRLVFATPTSATEPHYHPLSPCVEQRRSAPIERDLQRDPVPKPRSRRCFVCGTTGTHSLDFRVCPRTFVLLRRSLAKFDDAGRLVSIDGSPLPMTRHPGGVAAHLISRAHNPTRFVAEPSPNSLRPPHIAHVPPRPAPLEPRDHAHAPPHRMSIEPRDRVTSPSHEFNSSSPQVFPPNELIASAPECISHRHATPQFDVALSRARSSFLAILLTLLLDINFRLQLRAILLLLDSLNAESPTMFRQRMQPVFTRICHLA